MVMVGWGRAFKGAIGWFVYSLIWLVTGGVLMIIGLIAAFASLGFVGSPIMIIPIELGLPMGIVLFVLGLVIASLGSRAANYKVISEMVAEEVVSRRGQERSNEEQSS